MEQNIRDILNKAVEENKVTLNSLLHAFLHNIGSYQSSDELTETLFNKLEELDREWLKDMIIYYIYAYIRDEDMSDVFEELYIENEEYEE